MSTSLWMRRKYFDSYGNRRNEQAADLPPRGIRLTCPCCGYPTLRERGAFGICYLCAWEDDGQDDPQADEISGGPNQDYSLAEARLNFEKYMVMYPADTDTRIGGQDSELEREVKLEIVEAFDKMMAGAPPEELNTLWRVVAVGEKALRKEMKRRIREHSIKNEA